MNILLALIFISLLPFLYLFNHIAVVGNFTYAFANIAGFIGAVILLWEFVLGIKDLAQRLPIDTRQFIKLHIFLGVWGMFFVLVHPILEMVIYLEDIAFLYIPDFSTNSAIYITLGRFALILVILVWLSSSFLRNRLSYKRWLNIHYLSYPMMGFVFIHALDIGSFISAFVWIKLYWICLFIAFIGLSMWRIVVLLQKRKAVVNFTPLKKNEY